ncbi:MAG: leucine-rich repeat protein [Treponema sp.]|nr:leucine-rich repeat protein [Treponema sp.]
MEKMEISNGVLKICRASNIEVALIPDGIHTVGKSYWEELFSSSCKSVKRVVLPKSVKRIYAGFRGQKELSSLEFGGTMAEWKAVKISDKFWRSGTKLKTVKCSDGVVELEPYDVKDGVLTKCHFDFVEFAIGDGVTEIADEAFSYCTSLEKLEIPESVKKIGKCSFAFCKSLKQIVSKSSEYPCENGLLFSKKTSRLLATVCGKVTIPAFIKSLDNFSLQNCTEVAFEKGGKITAETLDYRATAQVVRDAVWEEVKKNRAKTAKIDKIGFTGSDSLLSAILEESGVDAEVWQDKSAVVLAVKALDYGLEIRLSSKSTSWQKNVREFLKSVKAGANIVQLIKAAEDNKLRIAGNQAKKYAVFQVDVKDKNMYFNGALETVYIADGVSTIGSSAFWACRKLKTVYIPKSVTKIKCSAFVGNDSLKNVTFDGTFSRFNMIQEERMRGQWGNKITVHCTDGDFEL